MRITGGKARGRTIRVPPRGVRPTQDRLRESLFSSLGTNLPGWRVLDLFAGSGALGLEAWSRGAASVVWVERDPRTYRLLRENVAAICGKGEGVRCVRGDAADLRRAAAAGGPFDLVLADPPYARADAWRVRLLRALKDLRMVSADGLLAFEQDGGTAPAEAPGWELVRDRAVGGSRWLLYRFCGAGPGPAGTDNGEPST